MKKACAEDTIAALSTPPGEGGIGIVRLSGPESVAIADRIFTSPDGDKPSVYDSHTVHYGHISVPDPGKRKAAVIDEVLLTLMRGPRTYTREDIVEINCHGGIQAVRRILDLVLRAGARMAEPGEFTKRAFLNGRIDLAQAEAVIDVIRAKTEGSLKVAMSQLEGELSGEVGDILDSMLDMAADVEASIDFPDEELPEPGRRSLVREADKIIRGLRRLAGTFSSGSVMREGVMAIICGKPNVGKSSLMNLLLKRDRVIVSPIPGTTRDAVEEIINLRGVPVRLVDTAGIIDTRDLLEREGIARSKRYLEMADIAILVIDNSVRLDDSDLSIIKLVGKKKKMVVINKCDLKSRTDRKRLKCLFAKDKIVEVSVSRRSNIEALENGIAQLVWSGGFEQGEAALVSSARHKELLDKALANMLSVKKAFSSKAPPELASVDLREAVFNMGLITGKSVSGDVLDRIFEKFCIGK